MLNNLSPYFPFVSNFLLHLTYAIAFRVPFIDITDALNNFFFFGVLLARFSSSLPEQTGVQK